MPMGCSDVGVFAPLCDDARVACAFERILVEKSDFTVTRMIRLLGVSRSGFYA
jgi:hypothetical protein